MCDGIRVSGVSTHSVALATDDPAKAVKMFREAFPGARIGSVGDRPFVGTCEFCGAMIYGGDDFHRCADADVFLCAECFASDPEG